MVFQEGGGAVFPLSFSISDFEESMAAYSQLIESIGRQREAVIGYQSRMTAIPALGPDNGGTGEMPKASCAISA